MGLKTKGMKKDSDKFPLVLELDVYAEENTAKKIRKRGGKGKRREEKQ